MQAWQIRELGGQPVLSDVPTPIPVKGEVAVRVAAAGLNFADMLAIQGKYQVRQPLPFIPGMEISGTVEALGPGVDSPAVGTRSSMT